MTTRSWRLRIPSLAGLLAASLAIVLSACRSTPAPTFGPWTDSLQANHAANWHSAEFGGEGDVELATGSMRLGIGYPLTGATWTGTPPAGSYQVELTAARLDGMDFFCGLTFPVRDGHLTLVLGGWGGSVCGLSNLDGLDAASNDTRTLRGFRQGRDYRIVLDVTDERVAVTIDGKPFLATSLIGRELSVRPEVLLNQPIGLCSFSTEARISQLRWRSRLAP